MQKQTVEWQAPQFCPWGLKIPHNIQQTTTHFLPPAFPYCCWCCCCINIVNSNNYRRQKQQQQGFDILFLVGGWEIQPPLQLPLPPGSNAPVSCRIPILSSRFLLLTILCSSQRKICWRNCHVLCSLAVFYLYLRSCPAKRRFSL